MSRKAVVLGSGGQLGFELCREFGRRGWNITPLDRSKLDVTSAVQVEQVLLREVPDLVINSAAYNQVDVAETEPLAALQANSLAVRNLAVSCAQIDAKLIHYSTDYVFDGTANRPYIETDLPRPLGAYGVSKLTGELFAAAYLNRYLVIRTSGVFGPAGMFTPRGNFVEFMLRLARNDSPIRVVEDHFASPSFAPAIAVRSADLIDKDQNGLFHIGGGEAVSWFAFAKMIFEEAHLTPAMQATNEREYRTTARRPKFSALSNSKLESVGVAPMPPLREAVRQYLSAREHVTSHR